MNSLGDLLRRNLRQFADETLLVQGERRFTCAAHMARSERLIAALAGAGCRSQDRVSILAMNCTEYMEVFSACWLHGFIISTVNFRLAAAELAWMLDDAAPHLLIFEAQYAEMVASLRPGLPGIRRYVCIGATLPWAEEYETFLETAGRAPSPRAVAPEDIAHLIYTSGTTGRPKGVMRSHRMELATAMAMATMLDSRPGSRIIEVMPLFHTGAQTSIFGILWRGGEIHLHRGFDAAAVLAAITKHRITHLHLVPLMVQSLVELPIVPEEVASIETILYAAAPMPVPVLRRGIELFGQVFVNGWGQTEGTGTSLDKRRHAIEGPDVAMLGSIGFPAQGMQARIVDEAGEDLPAGGIGEVWLSGPAIMTGYWNNSAATIDALRDGWLRKGDMGRADAQGQIFLVDRKKDMIISGGENIYSQEVERALASHPAISGVAVIGVPDAKWGEAVRAIVTLHPGHTASEAEIIAYCATEIASYKKPKRVIFVDSFPALPSGKVNKRELRARYGS